MFTRKDFETAETRKDLLRIADRKGISLVKTLRNQRYGDDLLPLQIELVQLEKWVEQQKMRVAIIFEGRDAAGKGGSIKRFTEHLNPRSMRVVALSKPTEVESGQWYFRRYIKELPNPGEMVFFDRSWYNRAIVEPVMGFCTTDEYSQFMIQVTEFEHMLYQDGIRLIKLWFEISKDEQRKRFHSRISNPLKKWKFSPVDMKGQELWDEYTTYKEKMFSRTHTAFSPWTIIKTNNKRVARLESIRHVLSQFEYPGNGDTGANILPDPNVVIRYYRDLGKISM